MSDLISRQAAISYAISGRIRTLPTSEDGENWIRTSEVRQSLLTMPSAQPEITLESAIDYLHSIGWMQEHDKILTESAQPEPKKGKWIVHPEVKNVYGGTYIECSQCGEKYVVQHMEDEKYCRNCGAKMEK